MTTLSTRLDAHFRLAAAAAAAAAATTTTGEAAIIYSGLRNAPVFPISVNGGFYFDFEWPFASAQGSRPDGWDVNPYASGSRVYLNANTAVVLAGGSAADLAFGTPISAASLFSPNGFFGEVAIPAGSTGFLGFRFTENSSGNSSQTYYAWARLQPGLSGNGQLLDWAYDDSGAPLAAGTIPEPDGLGLLALGAAGLAIRRRRLRSPGSTR